MLSYTFSRREKILIVVLAVILVGLAWFFTTRNNGMQVTQSPAFAEQDTIEMTDSITSEMLPYNEE